MRNERTIGPLNLIYWSPHEAMFGGRALMESHLRVTSLASIGHLIVSRKIICCGQVHAVFYPWTRNADLSNWTAKIIASCYWKAFCILVLYEMMLGNQSVHCIHKATATRSFEVSLLFACTAMLAWEMYQFLFKWKNSQMTNAYLFSQSTYIIQLFWHVYVLEMH